MKFTVWICVVDRGQFKILVEKCDSGSLDELELDIGVVLLRRR